MKIIDCKWELKNINKRVQEIDVEETDSIEVSLLPEFDDSFDMVVVKCPINKIDYNIEISKRGAFFIESQFELTKNFKTFNFEDRFIKSFMDKTNFIDVIDEKGLELILDNLPSSMFTTDRVSLDPRLGPELGTKRYKNWMRNCFYNKTASFFCDYYKDELVGYVMYKQENGIYDGMLGGLFNGAANPSLGLLTPAALPMYAKKRNLPMKAVETAISSNNLPVLRLYEYCGFSVKSIKYVFVKHFR